MSATPSRSSTRAVLLVLAAGAGAFAVLQSLVMPVLPDIQARLETTQNTVTWVLTANLLSAAVCTPVLGRIGDMVGKKRTLVAVLATLAVGCVLAALAPNIGVLIAARVIQGAAGSVFPLAYGIIRDHFPGPKIAPAVSAVSAVVGVGGGLGIVLAGPIVSGLGFPWLFLAPALAVAAAAVAAIAVVPESPVSGPVHINWTAAALLAGWLVCLLLGFSLAPVQGWTAAPVLGLLGGAVLLLGAWVAVELRAAHPLIDMRIMRLRAVWTTNLAALLFGAAQFSVFGFLPQFVQTDPAAGYGFGADLTATGPLMLPMLVAMFLAGIASGRISHIAGPRMQLAAGSALSASGLLALALIHELPWQVAAAGAVFGAGAGAAIASMANLIVSSVPSTHTGAAGGMNANFRSIGGAIGTAITSSIVTAGVLPGAAPPEDHYGTGFLLLAGLAAAACAAALLVPAPRRAAHAAEPAAAQAPQSAPVPPAGR
ncbi:MFS transporter [Streptomonospora sediminis]